MGRECAGVNFVFADTDAGTLSRSSALAILQLGSSGDGAKSYPENGRKSAEEPSSIIRQALEGTRVLFLVAGLGGGTGSGAAPVVARIAREMGILTFALVTLPFGFEGSLLKTQAEASLSELEAAADCVIAVSNDELMDAWGDEFSQEAFFASINDAIASLLVGVGDLLSPANPGAQGFEEVRTAWPMRGRCAAGSSAAAGSRRAVLATQSALAGAFCCLADLSKARSTLVLISTSQAVEQEERDEVLALIHSRAFAARLTSRVVLAEGLEDALCVTVLVSCPSERPALTHRA
jgi:cell division protein FtsZ